MRDIIHQRRAVLAARDASNNTATNLLDMMLDLQHNDKMAEDEIVDEVVMFYLVPKLLYSHRSNFACLNPILYVLKPK